MFNDLSFAMNFSAYLQQNSLLTPISEEARAVNAWKRINDKAVSITIYRNGAAQAAQTVRIEHDESATQEGAGVPSAASERGVIVFGVKNHPEIEDSNLAVNDRFNYGGSDYEVMDVILTTGEVQAKARRLS